MKIKTVELFIPHKYRDEPLFYDIVIKFKVIPRILEASFTTEMGWAIVKFEGKEEELEKLFSYLKEKEIEIKFR